jgi:hypothetical protein
VKFIEVPAKRYDSKLSRGIDNIGSTTGVSILDGLNFLARQHSEVQNNQPAMAGNETP